MKKFFFSIVLFTFIGCADITDVFSDFKITSDQTRSDCNERPIVNIPFSLRQANYLGGSAREGSCTWASFISLLRWQERRNTANWVRQNYGGGTYPAYPGETIIKKLETANIRYAYITNGDVNFLEWACETGRGCMITIEGGEHMVMLVHLDNEWAGILDNNTVDKYIWIPRRALVTEWKASFGFALTPVYSPAAPLVQ